MAAHNKLKSYLVTYSNEGGRDDEVEDSLRNYVTGKSGMIVPVNGEDLSVTILEAVWDGYAIGKRYRKSKAKDLRKTKAGLVESLDRVMDRDMFSNVTYFTINFVFIIFHGGSDLGVLSEIVNNEMVIELNTSNIPIVLLRKMCEAYNLRECSKSNKNQLVDALSRHEIVDKKHTGKLWRIPFKAIIASKPAELRKLFDNGADPNTMQRGMTPLFYAAYPELTPEILKILIEAGADVSLKLPEYGTPLSFTLLSYYDFGYNYKYTDVDMEKLEILLQSGANPNIIGHDTKNSRKVTSHNGMNPLQQAIMINILQEEERPFDLLLEYKADVNVKTTSEPSTLLMSIRMHRNGSSLPEKLIKAGAKINAKDSQGNSALCIAVNISDEAERANIFELLLENDANSNSGCSFGDSILTKTIKEGKNMLVELLIGYDVDVNGVETLIGQFPPNQGQERQATPVTVAIENNNIDAFEFLLGADVNLDYIDPDGNTYLHLAAKHNLPNVATYLLEEENFDPSITNKDGMTAYRLVPKSKKNDFEFMRPLTKAATKIPKAAR